MTNRNKKQPCSKISTTSLSITSGFPDDNMHTSDDFPTLGDPTRHSVGICRSTTSAVPVVNQKIVKECPSRVLLLSNLKQ
jgi:hypothetical protein